MPAIDRAAAATASIPPKPGRNKRAFSRMVRPARKGQMCGAQRLPFPLLPALSLPPPVPTARPAGGGCARRAAFHEILPRLLPAARTA